MPSTRPKPAAKKVSTPHGESKTGPKRRTINGIPLKRKVIWVYDTDSPEFADAMKRGHEAMKVPDADRDGMQFIEAVSADPEWQKWWTK